MIATKQLESTQHQLELLDQLALCVARLYWLALLLANNEESAAELTRGSATDLLIGNRELDRSRVGWGRRGIVRASIAVKYSELRADERNSSLWNTAADELDLLHRVGATSLTSITRKIRTLPILPRFVVVMHLLERYSKEEIADLLRMPEGTCEAALGYALTALRDRTESSELRCWVEQHRSGHC